MVTLNSSHEVFEVFDEVLDKFEDLAPVLV